MILRPYQHEAIDNTLASFSRGHKRCFIKLPTGAGKTVVFSELCRRFLPGRSLVLAHRDELVQQAVDKLRSSTGIIADIEKAENWANPNSPVVVGSVQSLISDTRRARWAANHFDLIVADECHHSVSNSWQAVLRHFHDHAKVLGVTATPDRSDERSLSHYYTDIPFQIDYFTLVNQGYLAPLEIKTAPLKIDLSKVAVSMGDFSGRQLDHSLDPYLPSVAEAIRDMAVMRKTLVFVPLVGTSIKFVEACKRVGLTARHIDGNSEDREDILKAFAQGEFEILSNAMLLTEGFDDPTIDCVVPLRPTKSRALYSQMVGRGTRIHPTKKNLLLLDFLWMHERHRICRPASLIAESENEADWITKEIEQRQTGENGRGGELMLPLDLQTMVTETQLKREKALRKQLEESAKRGSLKLTAEEFARKHDQMEIVDYVATKPWQRQDIAPWQRAVIEKAKIDLGTVKDFGHASLIVDRLRQDRNANMAKPASDKVKKLMAQLGNPDFPAETATVQDGMRFFAWLNKKKKAA